MQKDFSLRVYELARTRPDCPKDVKLCSHQTRSIINSIENGIVISLGMSKTILGKHSIWFYIVNKGGFYSEPNTPKTDVPSSDEAVFIRQTLEKSFRDIDGLKFDMTPIEFSTEAGDIRVLFNLEISPK